jgi:glycosyltransferase involved in cell wall biosynthesis
MSSSRRTVRLSALRVISLRGLILGWFYRRFHVRFFANKILRKRVPTQSIEAALCNKLAPMPLVSVVIPTNNGYSKGICALLDSLYSQSHTHIEVIAVDSGSEDGTPEYLESRGCKVLRIKPETFTHSFSRNTGAAAARGDYLLFTVDDAKFADPEWLTRALQLMHYTGADSLSSAQRPAADADIYAATLAEYLHSAQTQSPGIFLSTPHLLARLLRRILPLQFTYQSIPIDDTNHLVRKASFDRLLYRGDTVEDIDFAMRLQAQRGRVLYTNLLNVVHSHAFSIQTLNRYARRVFLDWCVLPTWGGSNTRFPSRLSFLHAAVFALCPLLFRIDKHFKHPLTFPSRRDHKSQASALFGVIADAHPPSLISDIHPLALSVYNDIFNEPVPSNIFLHWPTVCWWHTRLASDIAGAKATLDKSSPLLALTKDEALSLVLHLWVNRLMSLLAQRHVFKQRSPLPAIDRLTIKDW